MAFYGALGKDNGIPESVGGRHKSCDRNFLPLMMYGAQYRRAIGGQS